MGLKATSVRLDDETLARIGQMADAMDNCIEILRVLHNAQRWPTA